MITLVTGKIGGGKTYFCVNYLLTKYYEFQDVILDYVPKGDVRIVTNIRHLRVPHENFDELVTVEGKREKGTVDPEKLRKVMSFDFVKGHKNTVFIIDEAQFYFPRKYYDLSVFSFFQMSRHEGVDILLISQDVATLAKELQVLSEYEVRAVPRSKRMEKVFIYNYYFEDGEKFKRVAVKFRKDVAALYTSRTREESQKVGYVGWKYVVVGVVCLAAVVVLFRVAMGYFFFKGNMGGGASKTASEAGARAKADQQTRVLSKEETEALLAGRRAGPKPANEVEKDEGQEFKGAMAPRYKLSSTADLVRAKGLDIFVDPETGEQIGYVRYTRAVPAGARSTGTGYHDKEYRGSAAEVTVKDLQQVSNVTQPLADPGTVGGNVAAQLGKGVEGEP